MGQRISLCVIAGREAVHIVRMLDSFYGTFDELSLVIATGAEEPDDTQMLADNWCRTHGIPCGIARYVNGTDGANWPHVDNFAAARNAAMKRATGDWLMWSDCDDLFTGEAAELRRILAEPTAADVHHFPYNVEAAGKIASRERVFRRSVLAEGAAWFGPVHENFRVPVTARHHSHTSPTWLHKPAVDKRPSGQRNLRILSAAMADAPAWTFYIHQDYYYQGNATLAQRYGDLFLAMPGADKAMKYQCHLNLRKMADLRSSAAAHAMAAYWLFPRREAAAALTECALEEADGEKAMHWATVLVNTPMPAETIWCHEPRWYGWHGDDLYARAYRLAKGDALADQNFGVQAARTLYHETSVEDAAVAVETRDAWMSHAMNPKAVRHVFILDKPDAPFFRQFARVDSATFAATAEILADRTITNRSRPFPKWDLL